MGCRVDTAALSPLPDLKRPGRIRYLQAQYKDLNSCHRRTPDRRNLPRTVYPPDRCTTEFVRTEEKAGLHRTRGARDRGQLCPGRDDDYGPRADCDHHHGAGAVGTGLAPSARGDARAALREANATQSADAGSSVAFKMKY